MLKFDESPIGNSMSTVASKLLHYEFMTYEFFPFFSSKLRTHPIVVSFHFERESTSATSLEFVSEIDAPLDLCGLGQANCQTFTLLPSSIVNRTAGASNSNRIEMLISNMQFSAQPFHVSPLLVTGKANAYQIYINK